MTENIINAEPRVAAGKGPARRVRLQGRIPGVFYFHGDPGVPFSVSEIDLKKILKHRSTILEFHLEGMDPRECVIRELQRDPVDENVMHIDLMGIMRGEKLTVTVPIRLVGLPAGVKSGGGILQHGLSEVEVECLPKDIPEYIEIDVSDLEIGHSRQLRHLDIPTLKFLDDPKSVLASVQPPTIIKEAAPVVEAEGEAAEGEGKEEGEETEEK